MSDLDLAPVPVDTDSGEHDRYAHYAVKEAITRSTVTGSALAALCGKIWVPTRNPDRYPICPECKEIYEAMGGD